MYEYVIIIIFQNNNVVPILQWKNQCKTIVNVFFFLYFFCLKVFQLYYFRSSFEEAQTCLEERGRQLDSSLQVVQTVKFNYIGE